jgi:hypothetical protein
MENALVEALRCGRIVFASGRRRWWGGSCASTQVVCSHRGGGFAFVARHCAAFGRAYRIQPGLPDLSEPTKDKRQLRAAAQA